MAESPLMQTDTRNDGFPAKIFLVYVLFFTGQAIYNTYLNLYLFENGMSQTIIGTVSAITTLVLMLVKPFWGVVSDKSKSKNRVVGLLLMAAALVVFGFYFSKSVIWMAMCMILFTMFYNPATTLQDSYAVEYLNTNSKKWDFGHVRLGGTMGFMVSSALIGYIIGKNYSQIFWMMGAFLVVTALVYFMLPNLSGHRQKHEKVKYSVLIKNRTLVCIIFFSLMYSLGQSFLRYYPIYYTDKLGAPSQLVGVMAAVAALSEIPIFWFAGRIERRIGTVNFLTLAGSAIVLKLLLLHFVTNPYLVLLCNLTHGLGFAGSNYCTIKFINDNVPANMRSTAQTLNGIVISLCSQVFVAPLVGFLSDHYDVRDLLLIGAAILTVGVVVFRIIFPMAKKYMLAHPVEGMHLASEGAAAAGSAEAPSGAELQYEEKDEASVSAAVDSKSGQSDK